MRGVRWLFVGVLASMSLVATACPGPVTPTAPVDGGPIPVGATYRSIGYTAADAPQVFEKLRALVDDPNFAAELAPAARDRELAAIRALVQSPDGEQRLAAALAAENDAAAKQNATGRLPLPPTDSTFAAAGVPADRLALFHPNPSVAPTTTTVPKVEPAAGATQVIGSSQPPTPALPEEVFTTSVMPTGASWPADGSSVAWPVAGGTRATQIDVARQKFPLSPAAQADPTPTQCNLGTTGDRHLPTTPIPAFEGRVYTPEQGTFASTDRPDGRTPNQVVTYHGDLQTRMDPNGTGIRQFKVEAHLLSPTEMSPGVFVRPEALRGHIVVERYGTSKKESYFPGTANTEWHVKCYAEDLGQNDVTRAYVEAWVPLDYPQDSLAPSVDEPGFQVRFETIDNCWDNGNNCFPFLFYAADQSTVILQTKNGPKAYDSPVAGGSVAARVADDVMVDRDNNPTNDLASILKAKIEPLIGPALDGLSGFEVGAPPLYGVKLTGAKVYNWGVGLDLVPIGNDDEYEFKGEISFSNYQIGGYFGLLAECPFSADIAASITAKARVTRNPKDPSKLAVDVTSAVANVSVSNFWDYNFISLTCLVSGIVIKALGESLATDIAQEQINPLLSKELGDASTLNVDDTLKPGVSNPNGGGFGVDLTQFEKSCTPRGCQGGDVLLDKDGLALSASLLPHDNKPTNDPRRFPLVFDPSLDSTLADHFVPNPLTGPLTDPDGLSYKVGLFLHPTMLNQVLRALAEGASPGTGELDQTAQGFTVKATVAPIVVNQQVLDNQPAFTVFIPDLRVGDANNKFAVNALVGVDLSIDSTTRKLVPRVVIGVDVDTLTCGLDTKKTGGPYALCANKDWAGGQQSGLPSIPQLIGYAVNSLIPPVITDSLGEVEIPTVEGFDFLSLGDSEIRNDRGFLSAFIGTPPQPLGVKITPSVNGGSLVVAAQATGLPGSGPIRYAFSVADLNSNSVFNPAPGSATSATDAASNYVRFQSKYNLYPRHVRIDVNASRGNATISASKDFYWY